MQEIERNDSNDDNLRVDIIESVKTELFKMTNICTSIHVPVGFLNKLFHHNLLNYVKEKFENKNSEHGFIREILRVETLGNPVADQYEFTHALVILNIQMDVSECRVETGDLIFGSVLEYLPDAQVAKLSNGHIIMLTLIEDKYTNIEKDDICVLKLGDVRQYNGQKETMYMSEIHDVYKKGSADYDRYKNFVIS